MAFRMTVFDVLLLTWLVYAFGDMPAWPMVAGYLVGAMLMRRERS